MSQCNMSIYTMQERREMPLPVVYGNTAQHGSISRSKTYCVVRCANAQQRCNTDQFTILNNKLQDCNISVLVKAHNLGRMLSSACQSHLQCGHLTQSYNQTDCNSNVRLAGLHCCIQTGNVACEYHVLCFVQVPGQASQGNCFGQEQLLSQCGLPIAALSICAHDAFTQDVVA